MYCTGFLDNFKFENVGIVHFLPNHHATTDTSVLEGNGSGGPLTTTLLMPHSIHAVLCRGESVLLEASGCSFRSFN